MTRLTSLQPPYCIVRPWDHRWTQFRNEYNIWWERVSRNRRVVYSLTPCMIESLSAPASSSRAAQPLINRDDRLAELAFYRLCSSQPDTVAVALDGEPIRFPLWVGAEAQLSCSPCAPAAITNEAFAEQTPASDHLPASARRIDREAETMMRSIDHRFREISTIVERDQLCRAGWLVQQRSYCEEVVELQTRWQTLPCRPPFNMISGSLHTLPGMVDKTDELAGDDAALREFLDNLCCFATRWSISGFRDWALPVPQRPLHNFTADVVHALRGPSAVVSYEPPHQRQHSRPTGTGRPEQMRSVGALTTENETVFRMFILEHAMRQRVDGSESGVVTRFLSAVASHFQCGERTAKRFRSRYRTNS